MMNDFIKANTKLISTQLSNLGIDEDQQIGIAVPILINLSNVESIHPYPDEDTGGFSGCKITYISGETLITTEDFDYFAGHIFPIEFL